MKTKAQALADLDAKATANREAIEQEYTILGLLPPDLLTRYAWSYHAYRLYDRGGSLHLNYQRYQSIKEGENATLQTIREVSEAFPQHVPLAIHRDGCVGLRTLADAEASSEKHPERVTVTPIAPFVVTVEPAQYSNTITVSWIVETPIGNVDIKIEYALHDPAWSPLGRSEVRYAYGDRAHSCIVGVKSNTFALTDACRVLGNCSASVLNYAGGGHTDPGHKLIHWPCGSIDPPSVSVEDLVTALEMGNEVTHA